MIGNKRNFSLSIWDHEDNFLCLLKSANLDFNGQCYNEDIVENINGEKTLSFSIPMYIFDMDSAETSEKTTEKKYFKQNEAWRHIYNEQKIRYIEYDEETNETIKIQEFVLKNYVENRNNEEKIAECTCESLAVYELGKVGWNINFDTDYVTPYELELEKSLSTSSDLLTIDYWLRKIFYKETNLGRVSNTTECTYLLQGLQLRNSEGAPISNQYVIDDKGNYDYQIIDEPIASELDLTNYKNETGWDWEIQATFSNNPFSISTTTVLYEEPVVNRYIEVAPNQFKAHSYQKQVGQPDSTQILKPHPITTEGWEYVTGIKKRLFTVERSNIYSIIQDLCEIFEVWAFFQYEYDINGKICKRHIVFKTEAINEEIVFDFSYGKNLINCQRNSDSNELVTKLLVPDTESTLNDGNILSIKQATANPTGEGYLYNFKYFYDSGMLTSGEDDITSDEYQINLHCGKLKKYNNSITNLQKYLAPLYNRRADLESQLEIQEGSKTALIDNIQSIQDKIDAISPTDLRVINSWSQYNSQYNYIGELKTIATTTKVDGTEKLYINFGRDDIIYNSINYTVYTIDNNNKIKKGENASLSTYIPRYYNKTSWNVGSAVTDNDFTLLNTFIGEPVYSTIRDKQPGFIKGFYLDSLPSNGQTYVRIRYQYAPLVWYYMLIQDYWEQLIEVEENIESLKNQLQEINNKIVNNELNLNSLLNKKNEEILQFEKKYKPYIREGYWEVNNYQAQINEKQLNTGLTTSIFEGLVVENYYLKDLNLNESLNNYSYYINLNILASNIDIDSIKMTTNNPALGQDNDSIIPRYRGNDYEVFLSNNNEVIIGIAPSLIDTYEKYSYDDKYYKSYISYSTSGAVIDETFNWTKINDNNNPIVQEKFIYLSNDNILTDSINIYGNSVNENNKLVVYDDYDYTFDYAGYTQDGIRVNLDEQTSYSTDIFYDYITKITLKNTNNVNRFNNNIFIINYSEETTLEFLYQDAVKTSEKYSKPQITYDIKVADISSLKNYKNYKPILGQKVPIYDNEMGLNGFEGLITSISKELESPQNTQVTIATYSSRFEDVFQKLTATMTNVRYNENELYKAADSFNVDGTIKENVFKRSLEDNDFRVQLGVNNDITIDKKTGITLVDKDSNNAVKLIGNGIFLTNQYNDDSSSQWITGITGEGINAGALIAGNIDTKSINIWNSSEGQIRFVWNEEGISAYSATGVSGTSTNTPQDFVDYKKYVKFNYDGLNFSDNGKSALKLGWDGLSMQTQQGALTLDADNGLVLKNNNIKRLELGKLTQGSGTLYGLRLYDVKGDPSFQSDSDGDLWLARHIKIGGNFNGVDYGERPTAGIVGISTSTELKYEMGIMRDTNTGNIIWGRNDLRFYAGPQTKQDYLNNLSITTDEFSDELRNNWDKIFDYDPTLSKFKVDSNGNIIASGIDVGGWIGAGKILRSKNYEAILRSDGYTAVTPNYPVLAIGQKDSEDIDESGRTNNFRVYQDGSVDANSLNIIGGSVAGFAITSTEIGVTIFNNNNKPIYKTGIVGNTSSTGVAIYAGTTTNPEFQVLNDGTVIAKKIRIEGNNSSITGGNIGGLTILSNSLVFTTTEIINSTTKYEYTVGLYSTSNSTGLALQIGTTKFNDSKVEAPFKVFNDGRLEASSGSIGGWTLNSTALYKTLKNDKGSTIGKVGLYSTGTSSSSTSPVIYIGSNTEGQQNINNSNTKFKVSTDGSVFFKGGIYGWSSSASNFKKGLTSANVNQLYTADGKTISIEICQGLIIDMR